MTNKPKIDTDAIEVIKHLNGGRETAEKIAFGGNADEMELLGAMVCAKEAVDFFARKLGVDF